jgi:hypothetical protein
MVNDNGDCVNSTNASFVAYLLAVCPSYLVITSSTGNQILSGQTVYTCTTIGAITNLTYQWYLNSIASQTGPQFSVQTAGPFILTCVSTYTNGQDTCVLNRTLNATALGLSLSMMLCSSKFAAYIEVVNSTYF